MYNLTLYFIGEATDDEHHEMCEDAASLSSEESSMSDPMSLSVSDNRILIIRCNIAKSGLHLKFYGVG